MKLNCGIVGLPNVGKSTLFSALTAKHVPMENYPFCTVDPNVGVVAVPDKRLNQLGEILGIGNRIPAVVEFVDIAGLVEGASKGEGLGNRFLAHIREVGLIAHVVRCFEDPDIIHVTGKIDPTRDIEIVDIELALADLETVEKVKERTNRLLRSDNKEVVAEATSLEPLLDSLREILSNAKPARSLELTKEQKELIRDLHLTTMKRQLLLCNIDEEGLEKESELLRSVFKYAEGGAAECLTLCAQLESEIAFLDSESDKEAFLDSAGLQESGLHRFIEKAYELLGLRTFFTENGSELRAWTFKNGDTAYTAAGTIHTDFQKGFIKAEVYDCRDLIELGSVAKVREAGRLRIEGRDYLVRDGDVILFRFNR